MNFIIYYDNDTGQKRTILSFRLRMRYKDKRYLEKNVICFTSCASESSFLFGNLLLVCFEWRISWESFTVAAFGDVKLKEVKLLGSYFGNF